MDEYLVIIGIALLVVLLVASRKLSRHRREQLLRRQQQEAQKLIQDVSSSGRLPVVKDPPILLHEGEFATLMADSKLIEERAVRLGAYGGMRVAKGMWIGGGQSESHGELRAIDSGLLVLTNQRLVFVGSMRTSEIPLKKIVNVTEWVDALQVNTSARQKAQTFTIPNPFIWGTLIRMLTENPTIAQLPAALSTQQALGSGHPPKLGTKLFEVINKVVESLQEGVPDSSRRELYTQILCDHMLMNEEPELSYVVGLLAMKLGEFEAAPSFLMDAARAMHYSREMLKGALEKPLGELAWVENGLEVARLKLRYDTDTIRDAAAIAYYYSRKNDLVISLLSEKGGHEDFLAASLLGCAYFHQEKFELALNTLHPLVSTRGQRGTLIAAYLAQCLCKLNQQKEAVDLLRQKLDEWDTAAQDDARMKAKLLLSYSLGEALYEMGNKALARDQFKQVYFVDRSYKGIAKYADELFPEERR